MGQVINSRLRPLYLSAPTPERNQLTIVQKAEWASGPVWTDAENTIPPGFDSWNVQHVVSRYTD
jgi:hypothetical protein